MANNRSILIRDVYYNTESPACFAGADAVYRESKRRDNSIKLKDVEDFLAKQETYTLHKPMRRRFPRNKTETQGIDIHWQSDLADMHLLKHYNNGYCYILICIDVLSRFAFAEPIKRKTPEQVADAFKKMLSSGRKPHFLSTDRGKEYSGKPFQEFLKSEDIRHSYATSPDVKCAIAERYIRTLKSRIWRYFTRAKTQRYLDILPDIVKAINNSYHRTIKTTPASVNHENQTKIWQRLYGSTSSKVIHKYKVGDKVRISIEKHALSKGYRPNYSSEVFIVAKVLTKNVPAAYKLRDVDEEQIDGIFYNEELVRVLDDDTRVRKIEKIIKSERRGGSLWHLVKFADKEQSWIDNAELVSI